LATEGARAALAFAFATLRKSHVIRPDSPENLASIRVAEKLGERPRGAAGRWGGGLALWHPARKLGGRLTGRSSRPGRITAFRGREKREKRTHRWKLGSDHLGQ